MNQICFRQETFDTSLPLTSTNICKTSRVCRPNKRLLMITVGSRRGAELFRNWKSNLSGEKFTRDCIVPRDLRASSYFNISWLSYTARPHWLRHFRRSEPSLIQRQNQDPAFQTIPISLFPIDIAAQNNLNISFLGSANYMRILSASPSLPCMVGTIPYGS